MTIQESSEVESSPSNQSPATARTLLRYAFFKVAPDWRRLPDDIRAESKREMLEATAEVAEAVSLTTYSLVGIRGDVDFMMWMRSSTLEQLQEVGARLNATHLGRHSEQPYSFLSMTRSSPYVPRGRRPKEAQFEEAKYLFVYPFVKNREWYTLPQVWRQGMMREHIAIGAKYPGIKINTGYSYGLDDQEHMVSFESDSASDFVDLVMDLRESQQSSYTLRDTPIFTCVRTDMAAILDGIAG
ncbi:MAG: chlorite dismutase family protein [Chloroflexi bacterium]|nr:chlorite dismutase family protein [Chloroflexota bacterium]